MSEIVSTSEDGVATIVLNRPERRNAITGEMQDAYLRALLDAEADPDVRAIVVTGAGSAFCGGVDFTSLDSLSSGMHEMADADEMRAYLPLTISVPIIAAINGPAIGLGLVYALFTDVRFAAASASLSAPYARLGLIAEHGLSWLLPRLVGVGAASDLLLSGRTVDAMEAYTLGLVQRVVPDHELLQTATAYAREIAHRCSPRSVAVIRRQLQRDLDGDFVSAFDRSFEEVARSFRSPDLAEGLRAIRERRLPAFPPTSPTARPPAG
jgi:enoyl-CoA hydratase/carnithine racemase